MVVYPKIITGLYFFVTVYCINFIIFLCVVLKLFSFSSVSHFTQIPGDAAQCGGR